VEKRVSRRIALDEIDDGFNRLADGEVVRQIFVFP